MPEKFPPFFRQSPANQESNQTVYGTGPNLVSQEETHPARFYYFKILVNLFKKLSFFITVLFGLMLLMNIYYNLRLEGQRKILNQLANEVGRYTDINAEARDIDKKTIFYQKTLSQRNILGDKAETIFSGINERINLTDMVITLEKFDMTIEVKSPFDFADLMAKYLQSKNIGSISIQSADLNRTKGVFKVVLSGTYK
jgi:hypothetical protein